MANRMQWGYMYTQWSMQTHSDLFHYDRHDQHKSDEPVATEEIDMSKVCQCLAYTCIR